MNDSIDRDNWIVDQAKKSLTRPDDFGWFGDDEMFVTWGFAGINWAKNSDDILNESNFRVITKDLMGRFPEDFDICGTNHWAVGSLDQLRVRVLKSEGDVVFDNITEAFSALMEWHDCLQDYAIADESDFYDLEYESLIEYVSYELSRSWDDYIEMNRDYDTHAHEICYYVNQYDYCSYESPPSDEDIMMYAFENGLCKSEEADFWNEWAYNNNKSIVWSEYTNLGGKRKEIPGQLELEI